MKPLQTTRYFFESADYRLPIVIRRRTASRRMVLRYQPLHHFLSLTLPRYTSLRQGLRFVEEKRRWIVMQLQEHGDKISFADGRALPVLGQNYMLSHVGGRGLVRIEGDRIIVPGEKEFMSRRVRDWLIRHLRSEITLMCNARAAQIGCTVRRISLRDTSSHWGSCSHDGSLSFSWRLIFAPREVLDYIVCHEVAHLKEHNHSAAFWQVVASLCPDFNTHREWMKQNGATLYKYGN